MTDHGKNFVWQSMIDHLKYVSHLNVTEYGNLTFFDDDFKTYLKVTVTFTDDNFLTLSYLEIPEADLFDVMQLIDILEERFDMAEFAQRALFVDCSHSFWFAEVFREQEWVEIQDSCFVYGQLHAHELKACKCPTVLHYASKKGEHEAISDIIKNGANIDAIDRKNCETALMIACAHGQDACVRKMIEHSADVNICKSNGQTALMIAANRGYSKCVHELVNGGARLDLADIRTLTALHVASEKGHSQVVKELIIGKASLHKKCFDGSNALILAATYMQVDIVHLLLDAGAKPNLTSNDGASALMWVCNTLAPTPTLMKCKIDISRALIVAKANVNRRDNNGATPLMFAAFNSYPELVSMLIEAGAKVNAKEFDGSTALMNACMALTDNVKCVDELIKANAFIDVANKQKKTALSMSIENSMPLVVRLLLQNFASVSRKEMKMLTNAKWNSNIDQFEELIVLATGCIVRKRVRKAKTEAQCSGARTMINALDGQYITPASNELNHIEYMPGGPGYSRVCSEWKERIG